MDLDDLQVVVALTARLAGGEKALGTLTPTEWDVAAMVLYQQGKFPRHLLGPDADSLLTTIAEAGKKLTPERLSSLLVRHEHAGLRLRDWAGQGIQVLGRGDTRYPTIFKDHLEGTRPPLLWGRGNLDLLKRSGVAIVGSRDAEYRLLRRAGELGEAVAAQGLTVISGGARGIDERAVEGALMAGGQAVVILPDSLAVQARKVQFREFLDAGQMALVSPWSPDAGYQNGTAMGRNRLIYCLARAAFVVRSTRHAGGTFAGAQQALKSPWTRMWIERTDDPKTGNFLLGHHEHASWLPTEDLTPVWSAIRQAPTEPARSIREESTSWVPFE